jgi:hypothetical protein
VNGSYRAEPQYEKFDELDYTISSSSCLWGEIGAEIRTDMDIWLKYHVAFLFPSLAPALYAAGTDNYCLARTRDLVVLALRAMREGFRYQGGRETRRQAAGRARGFVARGPIYEEALKHPGLACFEKEV